jgi:hypothetical protein
VTAARTKSDWSLIGVTRSVSGQVGLICSILARMPSTMASVDVAPFFSTDISAERLPSTYTMFVCGELPSCTCATSRMLMVLPPTTLIGRLPSSLITEGALLSCSVYSRLPIFCVPIGTSRFCAASACATSAPERPRACIAALSWSICTSCCLPPYGNGIAAGHLLRRQAGVLPRHRNHRDADLGEDVGGHAQRHQRADQHQQQRHHHERVRPPERRAHDADQHRPPRACPLLAAQPFTRCLCASRFGTAAAHL